MHACSCRPYGAPFFGGLVAPFAVIYIMNWVFFILIFVSLLRKSNLKSETKQDSMKTKFKQQFIAALTLSLLFGLGWGVGLAATNSIPSAPVSATLQAIFILLTGFQGLLIFIMHCIRCEEARKVWKEWLYIVTCHRVALDRKKFASRSTVSNKVTLNAFRTQPTSVKAESDTNKAGKNYFDCSKPRVDVEKMDEENIKYELQEFTSQKKDGESHMSSSPTQIESSPFITTSTSPGEDSVNQSSLLDPNVLPAVKEKVQDACSGGHTSETPSLVSFTSPLFLVGTAEDESANSEP